MPDGGPRYDLPTTDDASQFYWDAARAGRLVAKRCRDCGDVRSYPRPFCPNCWSRNVEWLDMNGRATLYTYSIVYQNDLPPFGSRVPYVAAIVELEEGPRLMTNIVDCEFADISIGMPLEVKFHKETDEFTCPVFRPAR